MDLRFRFAEPADVESIVELVESAYRGDSSRAGWTTEADLLDGQRTDAAAVLEAVTAPDRGVLVVESDDRRLLGCCELQQRSEHVGYFGMFAVSPALQGSGVGGRVLAEAERFVRDEWAVEVMEMTVIAQRSELIEWYERRGYVRTGERRPFPHGDERFGLPRRTDLEFLVLAKSLAEK